MIIQYRSIRSLMSDILDDYDLANSDWFYKSIGWIARSLEIMQLWNGYDKVTKKVCITDYRGLLPCDVAAFMFATKDNCYLPVRSDFRLQSSCDCPSDLVTCNDSAVLNRTFIQTSFPTGDIKVHYYGIPTDDEGFPMIPDNAFITEAIGWFIMWKMLTSGYKHKVITDWKVAKAEWEVAYPRAQNHVNFPTPEKMQQLVDIWTTTVKDNNIIKYYFN